MHQEYKDQAPLLGYAGYPLAALTGALRLTHNKHWFSDVVGGAGVGILSTKISYAAYPWLKEKLFHTKSHATILPYRANGTVGIMFQSSLQ
ncbi:MAG: phosphatase PAP2 family protein [Arcticibacter sp.]